MNRSAFLAVLAASSCLWAQAKAPSNDGAVQLPKPAGVVPGTGAAPAPAYSAVRWNEDYSYLKDPAKRTDPLDPIKYIPLSDEGDIYLSLGGQARYRYEWFNNAAFGAGPQDDDGYHLLRVLAHADLHIGPTFRFFVQGVGAYQDGRVGGERPGIDENDADIHQAFADINLPVGDDGKLLIRGGRQNLIYGAQRLISPLDWTNTRRTFDGGRLSLQTGKTNTLDAFFVHPITVDEGPLDSSNLDQSFAGLYDTISLPDVIKDGGSKLDLYLLYLDRNAAVFRQGVADEDRYTVGSRFYTNPKPIDFDVEAAYQFGDFGAGDISAWMVSTEAGYSFADAALTPRLFIGFDYASGDDDPTDADLGTFNQLYPLGHAYLGYADLIGRQNIIDVHPGFELQLAKDARYVKKLSLRADYHIFWRASDDDGVYNAAGALLRAGGTSGASYIANEVDLLLSWQIDRHLGAYFGYTHVFPGDFIQDTGAAEDIDFLYAAVTYTF